MVFMREPKWDGNNGLLVFDLHGNLIAHYSALDVARDWLAKNKDDFANVYGFEWQPPLELLDKARIAFSL